MPLFRNSNVLLIHIPKTGGSSLEDHFINTYQKKCSLQTLLFRGPNITINGHSPQHCTYSELYELREYFDLDFDTLTIITSVRNPYHRVISDMFFYHLLELDDTPEIVEKKIKEFIESPNTYDNHKRLQIDYLLHEGKIDPRIKILKTETLTEDMHKLGYMNFNVNVNVTHKDDKDYMLYFNRESLDYINKIYSRDFEIFVYEKL